MNFLEYYFHCQEQYPDSIILIQKGKFYECYEYNNQGKAFKLGELINITVTLSNKQKNPSFTNPFMAGFQIGYLDRNLPIILDNNITVVVIDEDLHDVTSRSIKAVYSPGTYTENNTISNNIVCIYIEEDRKRNYYISISSVDLSTGNVYLYEIHQGNTLMKIEECYRINEALNPSEMLITSKEPLKKEFKTVFDNTQRKIRYLAYDNTISNLAFQNCVLKDVYNIKSCISAIEVLGLEQYTFACYSFVFLLKYCLDHNKHVVCNLNIPIFENFEKKMILHNNSIYQLNIVNQSKEKSLYNILDYTSTPMGKRLLYKTLLNPICDSNMLDTYYKEVENMIPVFDLYEDKLKQIVDIEKMHRKLGLLTLKPFELWNLANTYDSLHWILEKENLEVFLDFEMYYKHINNIFNIETLRDNKDYETNIFNTEVYKELDSFYEKIVNIDEELLITCKKIDKYIPGNGSVKLENDHIETTQARSKKIKEQTDEYNFVVENKTRTLIKNSKIDTLFHEKQKTKSLIKPLCEELYILTLQDIYEKYNELFLKINNIVAYTDLKKSKAKCATLNNFTKPILANNQCLQIENMKHPIITQLDNDILFDPYFVDFNEEKTGMLLYGVNGAGKSTYSKSIALNVVMAQSGHFVCASFMKFKPFERLYTRLGDADNIYKGQSSFFVEMGELQSILHYADSNSLIIGDEPCRGTEDNSALSIVAYTLEHLLQEKSTFVFATHLHMLSEISCIKQQSNLMIKHVSIAYNNDNVLIYTHKIEDGKCKRNYGLEIAQKVLNLENFTERTNELFNEITKKSSSKPSKYNKNVLVEKCEICNCTDNLHTHHIIFQKQFHENSSEKNTKGNLVILCEKHHIMTHQNKLVINGWVQSLEGRYLDYILI